jgi:glycogen debranching enzyme
LAPLQDHLADAGLGSLSEIFDGDAPHAPRGCIAQAWSVAETLRVWRALEGQTR